MRIINFYGSPGVGKTTLAAAVFVELKKIFSAVEINFEYAKILLDENRISVLKDNQLYVFAKQEKRFHDLRNKGVDYVVTDSPLILSSIYNDPKSLDPEIFDNLIMDIYNRYDNLNFLINRNRGYKYDTIGRRHSFAESLELDKKIRDKLDSLQIPYFEVANNQKAVDKVMEQILIKNMEG